MGKRSYDQMSASDGEAFSPDPETRSPEQSLDTDSASKAIAIEYLEHTERPMMQCSLPPHARTLDFLTLESFEIHYAKEHTNRCASCGRNLPSSHFLALHLDEMHNPVREALAAKGEKTYSCFVEDCGKRSSSPAKRRLHLIDKHSFPKLYNFRTVEKGIDNSTSLLRNQRKRRVSVLADLSSRSQDETSKPPATSYPSRTDKPSRDKDPNTTNGARDEAATREASPASMPDKQTKSVDDEMQELETSLSALKFVPRVVLSRRVARPSSSRP